MKRSLAPLVVALLAFSACGKRDAGPPASWQADRACVADADCAPAPSCCPVPCTGDVIHVKDVPKARARVDARCTQEERARCPQAGACQAHLYACVRGQCAMVTEGSPDWPKDRAK